MDAQGIFDTIYEALSNQQVPSIHDDGSCRLINEDDTCRCAMGHLMGTIPARQLEAEFPGDITVSLIHPESLKYDIDVDQHKELLISLQVAHDQPSFHTKTESCDTNFYRSNPEIWFQEWNDAMKAVANKFNLKMPKGIQ